MVLAEPVEKLVPPRRHDFNGITKFLVFRETCGLITAFELVTGVARGDFVLVEFFVKVVISFGAWIEMVHFQKHIPSFMSTIKAAVNAFPSVPIKNTGILVGAT
jgi:hypothetical protein